MSGVFFCKQKTAYEMRISDWSSDVCSSDLAGVIGAAHSGWKGAIGGVAEATVAAMEKLGADRARIVAAVGPTIARKSYEVDEAFLRRFVEQASENERFLAGGRAGHHQFDLEAYDVSRIAAAGLNRIDALGRETYPETGRAAWRGRGVQYGEAPG